MWTHGPAGVSNDAHASAAAVEPVGVEDAPEMVRQFDAWSRCDGATVRIRIRRTRPRLLECTVSWAMSIEHCPPGRGLPASGYEYEVG